MNTRLSAATGQQMNVEPAPAPGPVRSEPAFALATPSLTPAAAAVLAATGADFTADVLKPEHVLALQRTAGNQAVTRMLLRAPTGTQTVPDAAVQMDADAAFIATKLSQQILTSVGEQEIVERVRKWVDSDRAATQHGQGAAGQTPPLDHFILKLKICTLKRATARSAFMETTVNVFDTLFTELEDDRLTQFQALLASSKAHSGAGPASGPSENAWATVGRQELIGMFGMTKGLSTGLAAMGDTALSNFVKAANTALEPLGAPVHDPPQLAEWIGKQLDVSGDAIFDNEFTKGEELFLGQNAASIGTAGGSIIWNLVMLAKGGGTGEVAQGMKALDTVSKFKAVDDALTSMGDYVICAREQGKCDAASLLADDAFKTEAFKLAGALVGVASAAVGLKGESGKAAEQVLGKIANVLQAGAMGAKLGQISQILMDDKLDPKTQRAQVGKLVLDLAADAFSIAGGMAADADRRAAAGAGGGKEQSGGGKGPGGGSEGHGGGDDGHGKAPADKELGGGTVLEPHPDGHQNEPKFIPSDADLPDRGTGNREELFGTPNSSVKDHPGPEARLKEMVTNNQTEKQKAAERPGGGVVAAGELHVEGQHTPEQFAELSGGAGTVGAPDAAHVLRGKEVPLGITDRRRPRVHDQLIGEVIPSSSESEPTTKGVDEAFPTARDRQKARREEYLDRNKGEHEHEGPRSHDAERRVLDSASAQLAQNPTVAGELHLMPSHPPCPACTAAIHAFKGDHPNVKVFLYDFKPRAPVPPAKLDGFFDDL